MARIVPLHLLDPSPENPRRRIGPKALGELAASIRTHGVLEPLVVEPTGDRFLVVAGHRRLRAAEMAGLGGVPVEVRVAERVGLHPSTISNALQLLRPQEERDAERAERYRLRDAGEVTLGRPTADASPGACLRRLRESVDGGTTALLTPMQCRTVLAMLTRAADAVREARAGDQAVA